MTPATATSAYATAREYTLTPGDFERVRKLIHERTGISLHAGKQAMV